MSDAEKYLIDYKFRTIAILGGSFDPPTIAHIQTAAEVYNYFKFIDEVWLVPCGDSRSDKTLKASAKQRKNMLELTKNDIIGEESACVKICGYEVENGGYSTKGSTESLRDLA